MAALSLQAGYQGSKSKKALESKEGSKEGNKQNLIGLDDSLLVCSIFSFLDGYNIAKLETVNHAWKELVGTDPYVWQNACVQLWKADAERFLTKYNNSWKRMFIYRPHIRYDGIYVLETKYWRTLERDLQHAHSRTIEISYYRYLHFQSNGSVAYALLNEPPNFKKPFTLDDKRIQMGAYKANSTELILKVDVGHMIALMRLTLHETLRGAHNRLLFTEFRGKTSSEPDIRFPCPTQPFVFYKAKA
jgi:hypothetical protein